MAEDLRQAEAPSGLVPITPIGATLALSAALVAFVAANWQAMGPALRLSTLVGADLVLLAAAFWASRHASRSVEARVGMEVAASLAIAAAMGVVAVVGQIYGLPPDRGIALDGAIAALGSAVVLRSRAALAIGLLALIEWRIQGAFGRSGYNAADPDSATFLPLWGLAAAAVATGRVRAGSVAMTVLALAGIVGTSAATTFSGLTSYGIAGGRALVVLAGFLAVGTLLRERGADRIGRHAVTAAMALLPLLSFQHLLVPIPADMRSRLPAIVVNDWTWAALAIAVALGLHLLGPGRRRGDEDRAALWLASAIVVMAAGWVLRLHPSLDLFGVVAPRPGGGFLSLRIDPVRLVSFTLLPLVLCGAAARVGGRPKALAFASVLIGIGLVIPLFAPGLLALSAILAAFGALLLGIAVTTRPGRPHGYEEPARAGISVSRRPWTIALVVVAAILVGMGLAHGAYVSIGVTLASLALVAALDRFDDLDGFGGLGMIGNLAQPALRLPEGSRAATAGLTAMLALGLVLAHLGTPLMAAVERQRLLSQGREVVLAIAVNDPRDPFRGDFSRLRYEVGNLANVPLDPASIARCREKPGLTCRLEDAEVFTEIVRHDDGVFRPVQLWLAPPPAGTLVLKGRTRYGRLTKPGQPSNGRGPATASLRPECTVELCFGGEVTYGVETWYGQEGRPAELDRVPARDVMVVLRVGKGGDAVISHLLVAGRVFAGRPS